MKAGVVVDNGLVYKEETQLTVLKTSIFFTNDGFTVYDCKGELVFRVGSYSPDTRYREELVLMDAYGKCLLIVRRKFSFNIDLDEQYVVDSVEDLLKARTKDQRYWFRKRFKSHASVKETKQDVPNKMTEENWHRLCDLFSSSAYQAISERNRQNRAQQTIRHVSVSKLFVIVRNEMNEMIHRQQESIGTEGSVKSTDEIVDQVLGKKTGYVKGLRNGLKSIPQSQIRHHQRNKEFEKNLVASVKRRTVLRDKICGYAEYDGGHAYSNNRAWRSSTIVL